MERRYECPTCGCTRTIRKNNDPEFSNAEFGWSLQYKVVCGISGCTEYAYSVINGIIQVPSLNRPLDI